MNFFGKEIRWSEAPANQERSLEAITDIGIAFQSVINRTIGMEDSSIPAVYRSIQFLTDTVASLSMEEVVQGVATLDTPSVLANPNPAETYHDTVAKVMASLLFRGNAYLWPRTRDNTGNILSAIVLNPDEVSCAWDRNRIYPTYSWRDQPMEAGTDIIPIHLNRWPGRPDGVSPISACRLMLTGAKAEQNLSTNLMLDDASPGGAIKVPEKITKTEAEAILDIWESTHNGRKRPGVLGGGSSWESLTFSPVDAQFLESRTFSVQEIGRMFGLHGLFLLVPSGDSLTYSTTESLFRLTLTMTVAPTYLERIEQAFSRMLPSGRTARFNTDQLLRADLEARYRAYQVGLDAGFLTVDEVRHSEGLASLISPSIDQRIPMEVNQ